MSESTNVERIKEILEECETQQRSIEVNRNIDLDVGNLVASYSTELDRTKMRDKTQLDDYFKEISRDAIQCLLNEVWKLPTEMVDNALCAKLPKSNYILPREKRLPKDKPLTKWAKFAKENNIQKKKRGRKVWDDVMQKWVPRYGYEKKLADEQKNWVMEIKDNADPYVDTFSKAKEEKKERIAKNKYQRLHNMMSNMDKSSLELKEDAFNVRTSTRSMGVFDGKLRNERPLNEVMSKRKRKISHHETSNETPHNEVVSKKKSKIARKETFNKAINVENMQMLKVLKTINKKEVNLEVAVKKQISKENFVACRKINDVILSKKEKKRQRKKPISAAEHRARLKGTLPDKFKRTPKSVLYEKRRKQRESAKQGGSKKRDQKGRSKRGRK